MHAGTLLFFGKHQKYSQRKRWNIGEMAKKFLEMPENFYAEAIPVGLAAFLTYL